MTIYMKRIYFFGNLNFLRPIGKLKSIFDLAENLSLVLTKLDTELGLAQPQLVFIFSLWEFYIEIFSHDFPYS